MRPGLPHHYILPTLGHLRRNTAKRTLRLVRARRYGKREYVPLRLHWPQAIADSDHGEHMAVKNLDPQTHVLHSPDASAAGSRISRFPLKYFILLKNILSDFLFV